MPISDPPESVLDMAGTAALLAARLELTPGCASSLYIAVYPG